MAAQMESSSHRMEKRSAGRSHTCSCVVECAVQLVRCGLVGLSFEAAPIQPLQLKQLDAGSKIVSNFTAININTAVSSINIAKSQFYCINSKNTI